MGQANLWKIEFAFLKYMYCTIRLDGIGKDLGIVCFKWISTFGLDHSMREEETRENSVGGLLQLQSSCTACGVVHVHRSNYCVKLS